MKSLTAQNLDRIFIKTQTRIAAQLSFNPTAYDIEEVVHDIPQITRAILITIKTR